MTFNLATAYTRTGLPQSPENDAMLTGVMSVSLAAAEQFLNRLIPFGLEQVEVIFQHGKSIQLSRFPVERVISTSSGMGCYYLHNMTGMILFENHVQQGQIFITYEGGYRVFPADMELALWLGFDDFLAMAQGSGAASGDVESVTVTGVGTVRFATSGSSSRSGTNDDSVSPLSETARALLYPYKLVVC